MQRAVIVRPGSSVTAGCPTRERIVAGHHVVMGWCYQQDRLQVQRLARTGDTNGICNVGVVDFTLKTFKKPEIDKAHKSASGTGSGRYPVFPLLYVAC